MPPSSGKGSLPLFLIKLEAFLSTNLRSFKCPTYSKASLFLFHKEETPYVQIGGLSRLPGCDHS